MISPLAVRAPGMFTGRGRRTAPLYGVMLHTTGSGLPSSVAKTPDATMRRAIEIYTRSGGPHYVIGWDGKIVATIADENIRGAHAGMSNTPASVQAAYNAGTGWERFVSKQGADLWHQRWPGKRSPVDLIPDRRLGSINNLWLGIEMIPVTPGGSVFWAQPAFPGSRFTRAQHDAAKRLVHDIASRHNFPSGWSSKASSRLIGHSDINPSERDAPGLPLWDPGYHINLFDMDSVRGLGLLGFGLAVAASAGVGYLLYKHVFK